MAEDARQLRGELGATDQRKLDEYLSGVRVSQAQRLLIETDLKILDVALRSGFGSTSRFYEAFTTAVGQTPTAYREELAPHAKAEVAGRI